MTSKLNLKDQIEGMSLTCVVWVELFKHISLYCGRLDPKQSLFYVNHWFIVRHIPYNQIIHMSTVEGVNSVTKGSVGLHLWQTQLF